MKKNDSEISVLLTASGGIHTPGVIECLKNNYEKRKIRIICTDIVEQPLLRFIADRFYIVPRGNSEKYIDAIKKICKKEKINVIIPGEINEILSISNNQEFFNSVKIASTVSSFKSIRIAVSKEKVFQKLKPIGINIPNYYVVKNYKEFLVSVKKLGYPNSDICFKPSRQSESGGSKGFRILRERNTAGKIILEQKPDSVEIDFETTKNMFKTKKKIELLVMEYLSGDEFSVYVLANKGKMLYCIQNLRQKLNQHYSFEALTVKNKQITEMCKKITNELKLDYNVNIQFKNSKNGQPKLIEINPRIGGTIVLSAASGVNLPYFSVKQALGEKIPLKNKMKQTKMIRYWKEMYVQGKEHFELSKNRKKLL